MSPFNKTRGILNLAALTLLLPTLWNCSPDNASTEANVSMNTAQVTLKMEYAKAPLIDSLTLDAVGTDTLHLKADAESPYLTLDLFPGEKWKFTAKLYANGALMQMGEIQQKLEAGGDIDLSIQMHALSGFVYVEIPLGFGNPAGVSRGTLTLDDGKKRQSYPMETEGVNAVFRSGMLDLGKEYTLEIVLQDSSKADIYTATDRFRLDESTPVPELKIKSLRAKVSMAIKMTPEVNTHIALTLPAVRRPPHKGDIIVSEIFSAPDSRDTAQFEFIEIYNGSLDTLDLQGCTLGSTSIANKSVALTQETIAPNTVVAFSDSTHRFGRTERWLPLANSKGSVVLQCNGLLLDSTFYSSETDSLGFLTVPALGSSKYGLSSQLDVSRWQERDKASSWCLALPTPGAFPICF